MATKKIDRKSAQFSTLFVFLTILCCAGTLQAQPGFGPEVGIGLSTMHFVPDPSFTSASSSTIFSARIGGVVDFKLNKHVYFQTGISVSRKGQSREFSFYSSDSLNAAVTQTLTLNYIDVPVAVIFKTGTQGRGRVLLGLGVTPSYIIAGSNKFHSQGVYSDTPFNVSYTHTVVKDLPVAMFDIGVSLMAGYELPTGLYFKAYYTAGVRDIGLGGETDKNRMYGIAAGYLFGKGRNINKETEDLIDKGKD